MASGASDGMGGIAGFQGHYPSLDGENTNRSSRHEARFPREDSGAPPPPPELFASRDFGSAERLPATNIEEALSLLLSSAADLGEQLDPAHRFWQTCVVNRPGETRLVATIHPNVTVTDLNEMSAEFQRLTAVIGQFSRVQFTTPDNVSPLVDGSRSERIGLLVTTLPASPFRRSGGGARPGSPGLGVARATSAEIGSANSTPE